MKKKTSFIIGIILLAAAVCFLKYAANHPEMCFPWDNVTTYTMYGAYIWLIFVFLMDVPFWRGKRLAEPENVLLKIVIYSLLAFTQFLNRPAEAGFIALCRGFVILGAADIAAENLVSLIKRRADTSD